MTQTLAKLGGVYGILTAGHVLKPMGTKEVVGLVRFPSVKPPLQNFRLNLGLFAPAKTPREIIDRIVRETANAVEPRLLLAQRRLALGSMERSSTIQPMSSFEVQSERAIT
jgi:hypothetical protein